MRIGANRFTNAPLALKVHASLVLLAAILVWDRHRPGSWAGIALVAIVLWPLLNGSHLVWWVEVVAVAYALATVLGVRRELATSPVELSPFVDAPLLAVLAAILGAALLLLFLPSVRSYRVRDRKLRSLGSVVGVVLISAFPASALGVNARIPSTAIALPAWGGTLIGENPARGIAFYAVERGHDVCLVAVATHGGVAGCHGRTVLERRAEAVPDACVPYHITQPRGAFAVPPAVEKRFCLLVLEGPLPR